MTRRGIKGDEVDIAAARPPPGYPGTTGRRVFSVHERRDPKLLSSDVVGAMFIVREL